MTEIPILTKFFVSFIIFFITVIGIYLGLCVLKLNKKNERLLNDRNRLLEEKAEYLKRNPELSDTERKLIYIAINLSAFKKEIRDQGLNATYQPLKQKIWDSIHV